jgi:hypothetical protein
MRDLFLKIKMFIPLQFWHITCCISVEKVFIEIAPTPLPMSSIVVGIKCK